MRRSARSAFQKRSGGLIETETTVPGTTLVRPQRQAFTLMTDVFMILSASVFFFASHSGNNQPM